MYFFLFSQILQINDEEPIKMVMVNDQWNKVWVATVSRNKKQANFPPSAALPLTAKSAKKKNALKCCKMAYSNE